MKKLVLKVLVIPAVALASFAGFSSFVASDESGTLACELYCKPDPNFKCVITWGDGTKTTCDKNAKK